MLMDKEETKIKIVTKGLLSDTRSFIDRFLEQFDEVLEIYDEPMINALAGSYDTMLRSRKNVGKNITVKGTRGFMVNPDQTAYDKSAKIVESITAKIHRRLKDYKPTGGGGNEFGL